MEKSKKSRASFLTSTVGGCGEACIWATEGVLYEVVDGEAHVVEYEGASKHVYIAETYCGIPVTTIRSQAFYNCNSLRSVSIPDSVTTIGDLAFADCRNLTSANIPSGVTTIGNYAFENCGSLTRITVNEKNTVYQSIDGNLYSKDGKTLIQYAIGKTATSFTIPSGVTTICDGAFYGCSGLTSVSIPSSVTTIGDLTFTYCKNLTSLIIGNAVVSIGEYAFVCCDSLTIYCEGESMPSGWDSSWNDSSRPVYWYRENEPTNTGKYWHYDEDGNVVVW